MIYRVQKIGFSKSKSYFRTKKTAIDYAKHVMPHVGYKIIKCK